MPPKKVKFESKKKAAEPSQPGKPIGEHSKGTLQSKNKPRGFMDDGPPDPLISRSIQAMQNSPETPQLSPVQQLHALMMKEKDRKQMLTEGVIGCLAIQLHKHPGQADLVLVILKLLAKLLQDREVAREFRLKGGVIGLIEAIRSHHFQDPTIQVHGLACVSCISRESPQTVRKSSYVDALIKAIDMHRANEELMAMAFAILTNLAEDEMCAGRMMDGNIMFHIFNALETYPYGEYIHIQAYWLMSALSINRDVRDKISERQFIPKFVDAVMKILESRDVAMADEILWAAQSALKRMARDINIKETLAAEGPDKENAPKQNTEAKALEDIYRAYQYGRNAHIEELENKTASSSRRGSRANTRANSRRTSRVGKK